MNTGYFYGCGGRTRYAFSPQAKIEVETSVRTGFSKCPPDTCTAMGSSPAPCEKRKEKSHPSWDDFSFSGCGGRTRTYDLRVMSPTSFQLLYSAILMRTLECLHIVAQQRMLVKVYFLLYSGRFCRKRKYTAAVIGHYHS